MTMTMILATILALPNLAWLILAAMVYLLITCVLNTLAARIRDEQSRHDLIIQARERRQSCRRKGQGIGKARP